MRLSLAAAALFALTACASGGNPRIRSAHGLANEASTLIGQSRLAEARAKADEAIKHLKTALEDPALDERTRNQAGSLLGRAYWCGGYAIAASVNESYGALFKQLETNTASRDYFINGMQACLDVLKQSSGFRDWTDPNYWMGLNMTYLLKFEGAEPYFADCIANDDASGEPAQSRARHHLGLAQHYHLRAMYLVLKGAPPKDAAVQAFLQKGLTAVVAARKLGVPDDELEKEISEKLPLPGIKD